MACHPRWQQVGGNAAEVYAQHLVPAMFAPWAAKLIELAGVRPGERVLDLACGTGVVTRLAAERTGSAGRVVGLDMNAAMLAVVRSLPPVEGASVEWIEASALDIPLPDATFDVVLCQQGLQQFPDRPAAGRDRPIPVAGEAGRVSTCRDPPIDARSIDRGCPKGRRPRRPRGAAGLPGRWRFRRPDGGPCRAHPPVVTRRTAF